MDLEQDSGLPILGALSLQGLLVRVPKRHRPAARRRWGEGGFCEAEREESGELLVHLSTPASGDWGAGVPMSLGRSAPMSLGRSAPSGIIFPLPPTPGCRCPCTLGGRLLSLCLSLYSTLHQSPLHSAQGCTPARCAPSVPPSGRWPLESPTCLVLAPPPSQWVQTQDGQQTRVYWLLP